MYKLSAPLMSATVNEKNRDVYVKQCREAGVTRVFLCNGSILEPIPDTLGENVRYFKSQGFEVGIWTDTIGHGFVLDHVQTGGDVPVFTQMVNVQGKTVLHANCPLDEGFRAHIARHVARLAETGTDIVQLDDDFRMSQHSTELCCACSAHLQRIGEILGEEITLEQLRPYVLTGKANKYRDAWLQAQREGLMEMAKAIRAEVDKVAPHVTVCFCTACAPWNVDDADVIGMTHLLAGKNQPILRLTGAPYWATKKRRLPLIGTFEFARMLASFVQGQGFDLMSEGDVYPRPRYTCPATYLELYDAVTRADGGYTGILKYMFDYVAGPELETGYLKLHRENEPFLHTVSALFEGGANAGVCVVARPHTMKNADHDLSAPNPYTPRPIDGFMLGSCGIPTLYRGKGMCYSVFGEGARAHDLSLLKDGTVLDAVSAVILTERGVDVGLDAYSVPLLARSYTLLRTDDPAYKSFITDGKVNALDASLNPTATPLLYATHKGEEHVFAYRYENAEGQRFLVFLFDGQSIYGDTRIGISGLLENYATQRTLVRELPWVARKPLPAYCVGNPNLYVMCKQDADGMSIGLFNCFADPLIEPVITLNDTYRHIECVNCEATLDGNTVTLKSKLYGYTAAAFRVTK